MQLLRKRQRGAAAGWAWLTRGASRVLVRVDGRYVSTRLFRRHAARVESTLT